MIERMARVEMKMRPFFSARCETEVLQGSDDSDDWVPCGWEFGAHISRSTVFSAARRHAHENVGHQVAVQETRRIVLHD